MTSLTLPFRHTSMYDEYVLYFFFQAFAWIKTRTGSARDLRVIVEILMKGIETTWKKDAPGSAAVYKVKTLKP